MPMIRSAAWCGLLALTLGLALAGNPAGAQTAPVAAAPAAQAFFSAADIEEAVLSPSGRRLAITSARGGTRVGLFVIDLAGGSKPKAVAQYEDADIESVRWVNDELLIFGASDYSRGSGSPDGWPGLFSVSADGGKVRVLVKRKRAFVIDAGFVSNALEWNHLLLTVPGPRPGAANEEVLIGQISLDKDAYIAHIDPVWLNVRTGLSRSTDFAAPHGVVRWLFDGLGEPRLVFTTKDARRAVHWRGPGRADWQLLVEGDVLSMPFEPHAVDDAGNLYVLHNDGPEVLRVLARYDFERKAPSGEPVLRTPGFDFEGQLLTGVGGGPAQGVRVHVDAETTVWFDDDMKRLQAIVDKRFPGRVNRVSCGRCAQADAVALVRSYSDREPGQLWVYRAQPSDGASQWQAVARVMPGIDPRQMAAMVFQRIKARDGRDLPVWLTLPKGLSPGQPAPALVLVHGGPWVRGGYWRWDAMNQFLASRGYLVIEPEFRGSEGYGEAHYRPCRTTWPMPCSGPSSRAWPAPTPASRVPAMVGTAP
jgi:hypothetical protein